MPRKIPEEFDSEAGMPENSRATSRKAGDLLGVQRGDGDASAQARWLITSAKPWSAGSGCAAADLAPQRGLRPRRFMPVSMWMAALPGKPVRRAEARPIRRARARSPITGRAVDVGEDVRRCRPK